MITKDQIFELNLEDYSCPRYLPAIKYYYGTMDEIIDFMVRLEDNPDTCSRYKEMLDAAERYTLDNVPTHTVAGQALPIFTPVQEISRLETIRKDARWEYKTHNGTSYACRAPKIEICQTLVETKSGYELCVQANITGLQIRYPGIGWLCPNGNIKGFPGMVTFSNNTHHMALAVSQFNYNLDEYDLAMADAMDPHSVNLSCLVADILGEG